MSFHEYNCVFNYLENDLATTRYCSKDIRYHLCLWCCHNAGDIPHPHALNRLQAKPTSAALNEFLCLFLSLTKCRRDSEFYGLLFIGIKKSPM